MALTFADGAADRVTVNAAASINSLSAGTVLVWTRVANVSNSVRNICSKNTATPEGWELFRRGVDGSSPRLLVYGAGGTTVLDVIALTGTLVAGEIQFLGAAWDTAAPTTSFIFAGSQRKPVADFTSSVSGSGSIGDDSSQPLYIGAGAVPSNSLPGTMLWFGLWGRKLSLTEIELVRQLTLRGKPLISLPNVPSGVRLWMWLGRPSGGLQVDESGFENHGTVTGATVSVNIFDPYVVTRRRRLFGIQLALSASLSGSIASGGVLADSVFKVFAGAQGLGGSVVKQASKVYSGVWSGAGILAQAALKDVRGALPGTGTSAKSISNTIAGALSGIGVLGKTVLAAQSGVLSAGGGLRQAVSKVVAGSLSTAGAIVKAVSGVVYGTLSGSGILGEVVGKAVSGVLSSSGTLAALRSAVLTVSGTLFSDGGLRFTVQNVVSGALAGLGVLGRDIYRSVNGQIDSDGTLTALRSLFVSLAGALSSVGILVHSASKGLGGFPGLGGALVRGSAKFFSAALGSLGGLTFSGYALFRSVKLTLLQRFTSFTLEGRDTDLTLNARDRNLNIEDR